MSKPAVPLSKIETDILLLLAAHMIKQESMADETLLDTELAALCRRAFAQFGAQALWNKREIELPTAGDALVIARALRIEGDRNARKLAEEIEQACLRATH